MLWTPKEKKVWSLSLLCVFLCVLHREWTQNWVLCRKKLMKVRAQCLSSPVCTWNLMFLSSCLLVRRQFTLNGLQIPANITLYCIVHYLLLCECMSSIKMKWKKTVSTCHDKQNSQNSWYLVLASMEAEHYRFVYICLILWKTCKYLLWCLMIDPLSVSLKFHSSSHKCRHSIFKRVVTVSRLFSVEWDLSMWLTRW